jgi:hypothetical protein
LEANWSCAVIKWGEGVTFSGPGAQKDPAKQNLPYLRPLKVKNLKMVWKIEEWNARERLKNLGA